MRQRSQLLGASLLVVIAWKPWLAAEERPSEPIHEELSQGAALFERHCASCHGAEGQGVADKYEDRLIGDWSIERLARDIERTMPEDDPDLCVGDDALEVARFIYHDFYSPNSRVRRNESPPRLARSRLTVAQYRNTVADLLLQFTPESSGDAENETSQPGLRGQYFSSKGMNKAEDMKLERVDTRIDFEFGETAPADDIPADQFAMIWNGALSVDETGYYEFRVITENGARLYLNMDHIENRRKLRDDSSAAGQSALIDAWVSSGKLRTENARVYLLGGRDYPLRLEFFKYKEKTASIRLEWRPPNGPWMTVGPNELNTSAPSRIHVVETSFPPDDSSFGYVRGDSVSPEWNQAVASAAIETATEVVNRAPFLVGFQRGADDREAAIRDFAQEFAAAAFRRPLSEAERRLFGETLFENTPDPETGMRRVVLLALNSPSFLYQDLTPNGASLDDYAIASRLSFALWDSMPDEALFQAARDGALSDPDAALAQANRMLEDPRAKLKMRRFFDHWLDLEYRDLTKDSELFPNFDERTIYDLRQSLFHFLDDVVWDSESDYRDLLLGREFPLNSRLRVIYSGNQPADSDPTTTVDGELFQPVAFPEPERAGALTHPYLLSALAYHNNTSPIHRGVFLTRNILGRGIKPPPNAVAFKDDEFPEDTTMRDKITLLTKDTACMACHGVINPLGFALENYDAIGRWRDLADGDPVDSASLYFDETGEIVPIDNARDIAEYALTQPKARRAFVSQVFEHLIKQNPAAFGRDTVDELRLRFEENGFNIRKLLADIAATAALKPFDQS